MGLELNLTMFDSTPLNLYLSSFLLKFLELMLLIAIE